MSKENLIIQDIESIKRGIDQTKKSISNINSRRKTLSSEPVIRHGEGMRHAFAEFLPDHLMPKNVGHLNHVAWPFYYTVDFDLSTTTDWPNLTANTKQSSSFQVSQEAAFLMMGVFRHADDYNDAGDLGPLAVEFRDRQSSRFFNDSPIPIQMIGQRGYVSYLAKPMIILPNAFFEITLTTTLDAGVSQNTPNGSTGKHQFTMMGYRVRVEDAHKVLSSIFG
jgi:hypothetical protein